MMRRAGDAIRRFVHGIGELIGVLYRTPHGC
jgi:hypothetical protein